MTFTPQELIMMLVIAAICSAAGKVLAGGEPGGLFASTALGFVGAFFGPWMAALFHTVDPLVLQVSGQALPIVWPIIGAALFVALFHFISEPRWDGRMQLAARREKSSTVQNRLPIPGARHRR